MYRVSSLSLRKRSVVLLATVLIAIMGVFGVTRLKTELIPNIQFPVLTVITTYPGASPGSIDSDVTMPIVNAVRAVPGVKQTQSTSSEAFSVVVAEFDFGSDMKDRQQAVMTALNSVQLPQGAGRPDIQRIDINQFPVVSMALTGAKGDLSTLRKVAQQYYVPALSEVNGVSRVEVTGGTDNSVQIQLDPTKMAAAHVTPQQVASALQANNISVPAGAVNTNGTTLPVRVGNQLGSLDAIKNLIVGSTPGANGAPAKPVTLGEIAKVDLAPAGAPGIARTNGEPSVAVDVYLNQGANTVDTAAGVRDKLKDIDKQLAAAKINVAPTIIYDSSTYIQDSIDGLIREGLLGAVFAILVIFVFLLSVRSTLVTAVSIPLSVLMAFIILWQRGISLNIMTLGAMAVAIGRVVDDAIVVLESIYRHSQRGADSRQAALEGTKEVALAITASTLTTIAVFLPLGFVGGIVGQFFQPFALTVTFALIASLIVALTVVPVLASYLIKKDKLRPPSVRPSLLQRIYEPVLRWALRKPKTTLAIAAVVFLLSLGLAPFIGTSFLPSGGEKMATVDVTMPAGTSQDATLARATQLEKVIRDKSDVKLLQTQIGGTGLQAAFTGAGNSKAQITVEFADSVDLKPTIDMLRTELDKVAGNAKISISEQSGFGGNSNQVSVVVQGNDYQQVSKVATDLTGQIGKVKNLINVDNDVVNAKPQISVDIDPTKAAGVGSTVAAIGQQVREALSGTQAGQVTINGVPYAVNVSVSGAATNIDSLKQLPVGTTQTVPLSSVATVAEGTGPTQINRVDGKRSATITGTINTDKTGTVNSDVSKIVNDYTAPNGVEIKIGGVAQDQGDAFSSMGIALLVAVALVYIVMVASFGSLSTPFVILFSLPLAIIGVLVALFVTGKSIGLPALIGLLMLIGIVVTNAIVLLELVLEMRNNRGMSTVEALVEGGKTRIRPILMTALATILALIPLALTANSGAIIASDLAVVVIGGLVTSTLLTLIVVPVLFELINGRKERREAKAAAKAARKEREAVAVGTD